MSFQEGKVTKGFCRVKFMLAFLEEQVFLMAELSGDEENDSCRL
jgi:hypothetical protein